MARETGFILRKRKITAQDFVRNLMFSHQDNKQLSLLELKHGHFDLTGNSVSREALHKQFTPEAVSFMKALFALQLEQQFMGEPKEVFGNGFFKGVYLKDSSKFKLPVSLIEGYPGFRGFNKKSALMNIQYEYDLLEGKWKSLELTQATRNDQTDSKETLSDIIQGSLLIRDLGYATMQYLQGVEERGAYYLNRLPKTNVYQFSDGEYIPLNWKKLDKKMKKTGLPYLELEVFLGKDIKHKTRMVVAPVPPQTAEERVRKARQGGCRTEGYQLSKEYLVKAHYNIFVTNVQNGQLDTRQVLEGYRLRWQIELVFKTWKSNLDINRVKPMKKERLECQILGKLIWILLNTSLLNLANRILWSKKPDKRCSPVKFFKRAKVQSQALRDSLGKPNQFTDWYLKSMEPLIPDLAIERRLDKTTHAQSIFDLFCA